MRWLLLLVLLLPSVAVAGGEREIRWTGPPPAERLVGHAAVLVRDRRDPDDAGRNGRIIGWDVVEHDEGDRSWDPWRLKGPSLPARFVHLGEATVRATGIWAWGPMMGWDVRIELEIERFACLDPETRPRCDVRVVSNVRWRNGGRERLGIIEWRAHVPEDQEPWDYAMERISRELEHLLGSARIPQQIRRTARPLQPSTPTSAADTPPITLATLSTSDSTETVTWLGRRADGFCVHDAEALRVVRPQDIATLALQPVSSQELSVGRWWAVAGEGEERRLGVLLARTTHGPIVAFPGAAYAEFVPWTAGGLSVGPVLDGPNAECRPMRGTRRPEPLALQVWEPMIDDDPDELAIQRVELRAFPLKPEWWTLEVRMLVSDTLAPTQGAIVFNPVGGSWQQDALRPDPARDGWLEGQIEVEQGDVYFYVAAESLDGYDQVGTRDRPLHSNMRASELIAPMR